MVVGGPTGMVIPGATSTLGWITVSEGGGGGGGAAGTPAKPPMSVGLGKVSFCAPFRAPSMVDFQMSAGRPEPYTGPPEAVRHRYRPVFATEILQPGHQDVVAIAAGDLPKSGALVPAKCSGYPERTQRRCRRDDELQNRLFVAAVKQQDAALVG